MSDKYKILIEGLEQIINENQSKIDFNSEDFSVNDYAGGNIDDAFELGVTYGGVIVAEELRHLIDGLKE